MVVDSIHLPRPRTTTVIKYERLQRLSELRIKLGERFRQWALAHTRRAGKNNQTSFSFIGHVRILDSCAQLGCFRLDLLTENKCSSHHPASVYEHTISSIKCSSR